MAGWATFRAEARAAVHEAFGLPATYLAPGSVGSPLSLTVRWHASAIRHGDLQSGGYAEVRDPVDRLVFDTTEVEPVRNALVTVEGVEYRVDHLYPRNGRFRSAEVVAV